MRFRCLHCGQNSVRGFSKFLSHAGSPAECNLCGGFSCEPTRSRTIYRLFSAFGLPMALATVITIETWWLLLMWVAFVALFPFYSLIALPLFPLEKTVVKKAKWQKYVILFVFVLFVIWAGTNG